MNKRILTIYQDRGEFNFRTVTITENEPLKIVVNTPSTFKGYYHLIITHGNARKLDFGFTAGIKHTIELPPVWLLEGGQDGIEFALVLRNASDTVTIKDDYKIAPLTVEKVEGVYHFTDELKALREEMKLVKEKVKANEQKIASFAVNGIDIELLGDN